MRERYDRAVSARQRRPVSSRNQARECIGTLPEQTANLPGPGDLALLWKWIRTTRQVRGAHASSKAPNVESEVVDDLFAASAQYHALVQRVLFPYR